MSKRLPPTVTKSPTHNNISVSVKNYSKNIKFRGIKSTYSRENNQNARNKPIKFGRNSDKGKLESGNRLLEHDGNLQLRKTCNFKVISSHSSGSWQFVQEHDKPMESVSSQYFVYVPSVFSLTKITPQIKSMVNILDKHPAIDVVGTFILRNGVLHPKCSKLEMCHWTILTHHEYYCSNSNLVLCDKTSDVFVSREKYYNLLDWRVLPKLRPLDFFIQMKKKHATVVTAIDITNEISQLEPAEEKNDDDMALHFVKKYAVLHIKDLDTKVTFDICNLVNCDGRLHDSIFKKQWNALGTTMPPNFYEKFVTVYKEATKFLESNNVSYYVYGGANVGFL